MDNTKISHKDIKVMDMVRKKIEDKFGKMIINRGKIHYFVWMDIERRDDGTVNTHKMIY